VTPISVKVPWARVAVVHSSIATAARTVSCNPLLVNSVLAFIVYGLVFWDFVPD
jgi:hypothetical protein